MTIYKFIYVHEIHLMLGCRRSEDAWSLFLCPTSLVQTDTTVLSNITQMESRRILSGCPPRLWGPTQEGLKQTHQQVPWWFLPHISIKTCNLPYGFLNSTAKKKSQVDNEMTACTIIQYDILICFKIVMRTALKFESLRLKGHKSRPQGHHRPLSKKK